LLERMRLRCCGYGGKSAVRPSQRTFQVTSSSSWGR
jgi:hypothetical protein